MLQHNFTLEIILEITLKIVLKKVFQAMIGNQSDLNEIVPDDIGMGRSAKSDSRDRVHTDF